MDVEHVRKALGELKDPETGRRLEDTSQVGEVRLDGATLHIDVKLTTHSAPVWKQTLAEVEAAARKACPDATDVQVQRVPLDRLPVPLGQLGLTAKSVIAVGSGKGGVGKSTLAATIAIGLHRAGSVVGLLDADVYGPSIPHLLGVEGQPEVLERATDKGETERRIRPIDANGIRVNSMGFFVPSDQAVVWRGPMLHGAITQLLRDTDWGNLDYLIIDMPPGTGDIALTLSQLLPLTGAVVVCTPQDVALLDAVKAIAMFRKVNIPVLGMVENMSGFVCPDCGKRTEIFGSGGARRRAEHLDVPFLGEVPINLGVRENGDSGQLADVFEGGEVSGHLEGIVQRLAGNLAQSAAADPPMPSLPVL